MRAFPAAFFVLMGSSFVLITADAWAAEHLIKADPATPVVKETYADAIKLLIQCAIWIPYMLVSRRVKLTFTH
ncbi:MAG: DUF2569 family protein [Rariglobus sp.]